MSLRELRPAPVLVTQAVRLTSSPSGAWRHLALLSLLYCGMPVMRMGSCRCVPCQAGVSVYLLPRGCSHGLRHLQNRVPPPLCHRGASVPREVRLQPLPLGVTLRSLLQGRLQQLPSLYGPRACGSSASAAHLDSSRLHAGRSKLVGAHREPAGIWIGSLQV